MYKPCNLRQLESSKPCRSIISVMHQVVKALSQHLSLILTPFSDYIFSHHTQSFDQRFYKLDLMHILSSHCVLESLTTYHRYEYLLPCSYILLITHNISNWYQWQNYFPRLTYLFCRCAWFVVIFICAEPDSLMVIFVDNLTQPNVKPLLVASTKLWPKNPKVVISFK